MNTAFDKINAFIFDFDGVLTNNLVYLNQDGNEWVRCSRSDGLAFDVLRKLEKPVYILSTEENQVVTARARKLKIPVIQGVKDKVPAIYELSENQGFNINNIYYVGNDLNDYRAMQLCGYSACPVDSHPSIKKIAGTVLSVKGGEGVVRELLEKVFEIDFIKLMYPE
jgi:YrbI family 3-deoxy-D-manno-octulosonate 8-phosphate phosphatase